MFGLKTFLIGLFVGCTGSLVAMQIHVVNTDDGLIVLPRSNRPPISTTYVDVRKWSLAMWRQHPDVAEAALKSGRVDLLGDGALNSLFPRQAENNSSEEIQQSSESAKLALESLVPIKFATPEGAEKIIEPQVPKPTQIEDVLPELFKQKPSQTPDAKHQTLKTGQEQEVFPQNMPITDSLRRGLPRLQNPIPIYEGTNQTPKPSTKAKEPSDLFTDVLKALIPNSNQSQKTQPSPSHSAAYPSFRVEAPVPASPGQQYNPTTEQHQEILPAVRPF